MNRLILPVTLRLRGPILTKSSSIGEPGIDAVMAKSSFRNPLSGALEQRYYLPGSLVKGLLREAWQELGAVDSQYALLGPQWLGEESAPASYDDPKRGRLHLGDFWDESTEVSSRQRYRIAIDEKSGAASAQMLQVMDSPYAPGQEVEFRGEIRLLSKDQDDIPALIARITRGLLWVRAVGGVRSSGFGAVLQVAVGEVRKTAIASSTSVLTGSRWRIRLGFTTPVILSKLRVSDNLFESGEAIAGGALKGAVAEMLRWVGQDFQALRDQLHAVRFMHAFPALPDRPRPVQWPLSLISFPSANSAVDIVDVIREKSPYLRGDEFGSFDIDWKGSVTRAVRQAYGWPKPNYELRVRTAIESETGRARETALFAWRMLAPHKREWVGEIDTADLNEPARAQLEQLLRFGLEPIGKTRALASVNLEEVLAPTVANPTAYVVTLQTPALLLVPSLAQSNLRAGLQTVWDDLGDHSFELVNFFQRSSLTGGGYLWSRFSKPRQPGKGANSRYKPYLLSDAGSAFLLAARPGHEATARAKAESWLRRGLPLNRAVLEYYGIPSQPSNQWQHCPYLPENGYGEVTVNHQGPYPEAAHV